MDDNLYYSSILRLNDGLFFLIDLPNKVVKNVYKSYKLVAKEASYNEICEIFANAFNLKKTFYDKFIRFLTNMNPSYEKFNLNVDYVNNDDFLVNVSFSSIRIDENSVILCARVDDNSSSNEIDDLTKAHSKQFIIDKANEAIKNGSEFALMLLDIDNFIDINKDYGHAIGDIILIEAASIIKKEIAGRGYIARIGGDEFLIIFYIDDNYDKIHEAVAYLRKAISNLNESNIKNAKITATVGVVSSPSQGNSFDVLFKKANAALTRGKNKGRNCFVIYDEKKCGIINDDSKAIDKRMDTSFASVNNYNIISGAIEILNRENLFIKNINDTLSLIGNYFMLDRIKVTLVNPDNDDVVKVISWHNPLSKFYELKSDNESKNSWRSILGATHDFKINQVESNKNLSIYDQLSNEHVSAFYACELIYENRLFGIVRYDMCENNRFWRSTDISALNLLTKTMAIKLNREYINRSHYHELYFDELTGIYNYPKWRSEAICFVKNNPDIKYSIFVFDVRNFASLSNLIGSKEADKILILIAERLTGLGDGEIYARISADRFIVFIPSAEEEQVITLFNDIHSYIISSNKAKLKTISLHGGVYMASPKEDVLMSVDKAMLALRTTVVNDDLVIFNDKIYNEIKEQTILELHMEKALEDNEFILYLQPKINAKTGQIAAAEALTRWNFNFEKIIPPYKFIPLFERNGFITKLDFRVFENVCKFQRRILDENKKCVPISVNVSRYTSDFEAYVSKLREIRKKYDIPTNLIEIEITEGMYLDNLDDVKHFVELLRDEGYDISIDDFGSGYSNLINIAKLDFEVLKLDKTLCSSLDKKTEIIVDAIISTAKKTGHRIVCEGVETEEIYKKFRKLGADYIQGYYFDKPLIDTEFEEKYLTS